MEGRWYTGRKIRQIWQNGLCVFTAISKMALDFFLFFAILNHINIPRTNFWVIICWTFFPSELPLPTWVITMCHQEKSSVLLLTKNRVNRGNILEWVNDRLLDYFLWFSAEIDSFSHELRKFMKRYDKNMSKNIARVK